MTYYGPLIAIFQFGWASTQIAHMTLMSQLTQDKSQQMELCGLRSVLRSLSTHADRQGVDISVTICLCVCVCAFCVFVRLRISPLRIKLAASNFVRRFVGVPGRESPIFVNFAPPEAQNWMNRPARGPRTPL